MELHSSDTFPAEVKQQAANKPESGPKQDCPFPELRLVLLGRKGTGKSSSGNTILSIVGGFESGKPTEECVKRRADIANYRVTVVDTPGWEWYYSGNGTPGWVTRETVRSLTVCSPGPHALLLVIRSSASVTEDYYRQVEEHLELLGKTAWAHTLLLFTRGDDLGSTPIELRMQNAGRSFQKLFERCESRFHVLENKRSGKDDAQVKELIRKIVDMVKENGGRHYESDPLLLGIEVEGRRRARERRKKQRMMETQAQKGIIKAVLTIDASVPDCLDETSLFSRSSRRLPELRLLLIGERETGKSSAGNTILTGSTFFQTGQATVECTRQQAEISGRMVTVVDVPGWEGGPEGITPDRIKREICASVTQCPPGPHALLLTLRVDALVTASAVKEHLELLGEGVWRHTILLFTRGDQLREGVTIEQHIQGGGKDLHWLMDKCGNRYHVISSIAWESDSSKAQVTALLEKIEKMVSLNRCEAFSPVVQEIRELGKQKNERFIIKLKEVNEKLQRQELELRMMREREVKSIRRIFDWRKDKVRSQQKRTKERDEGMDRTDEDRKSIMSELEERMVWLTEDSEREIQELSLENSSLIAALSQGCSEREEVIMRLDEKEKESEELREKVDELQVNILELKRVSLFKEQERNEKEEELIKRHENAENELKSLRGRAEEMQRTIEKSKLIYEEEILNNKQEQEKRVAEKNELEKRLEEKQKEMEVLKLTTENNVKEQEERLKEINVKREKEKRRLSEMIELMTKEMEELQDAYRQQVKASEAARQIHEDTVLKYIEQIDKLVMKDAEFVAKQQKQNHQEITRNAEFQNKLKDKDAEISDLDQKLQEKEQEMKNLKQAINAKNRAMEYLKHEQICRIKELENEYKELNEFLHRENVFIKEEIEAIKKSNEENARKKKNDTSKILEVKENVINHLRKQNEESGAHIDDLKRQLKEVQIKVDNVLNEKAALIQEIQGFHIKCEDYERDLQLQIMKNECSEKYIKDILHQSEEMGKINSLNQENIEKKEHEICLLKERNQELKNELDAMNDKNKELEKKTEALTKCYEERLSETIAEMEVKDAEREKRLHSKEMEMYKKEEILRKTKQVVERGENELKKRNADVNCREQELNDKKQQLDKREHEINEKENKLKYQCENNEKCLDNLEKKEKNLKERENSIDSKHKELMNLSERQDLEKENIRKQLEEKKNLFGKKEKELAVKQADLQDRLKELEHLRDNLDIRDKECRKRELDLIESEQMFEVKMQELVKGLQELNQNKQDVEKWQAELNAIEEIQRQRSTEFHKAEQDLVKKEHNLHIQSQNLLEEIKAREQELLKKHKNQAASHDQMKNDLQKIKVTLEIQEQKQRSIMDEIDNREEVIKNRETDLNIKEIEIAKLYEEYKAAEKIRESKQKSQKEFLEKQEEELENVRKHIEENKKELITMQDNILVKQTKLEKEKKDLDLFKENLDNMEKEFRKREQQLFNLQQMCDFNAQEAEKRKHDNEKWQTDLTNKEHDLLQQLKELCKKEQELALRENNLQLQSQELIGNNQETLKELLAKREQHLTKKEEDIRSGEIYLKKREMIMKNRETKVQTEKEQNYHILGDLKKKQEILEEIKCSLETKQQKLDDLEKELDIKENDITNRELELSKRNKAMDIKEHKTKKYEQEIELRNQSFKNKEQELNELKIKLESKKKYLENHTATLENQKSELNIEKEMLKMKSEQLEKWGKHLYNKELKMINSNPSPDFKSCVQCKVSNVTHSMNVPLAYEELGINVGNYNRGHGNSSATEDEQVVKIGTSSKTTFSEDESEDLTWIDKSRRLEITTETGIITNNVDNFFQPASSDGQVTQGLFYQHSELKLMLIGETWSSRQSATRTILGQDVKVGSPWKGKISGKHLLVVEPHGIKWGCSRNINTSFENDLIHSISLCAPGPHAFILLLPAYLTFTRQYRRALECTMGTLDKVAWRYTIVLFTWAETLGESVQQHIKRNRDLEWLIQQCGGRYNVLDNRYREAHVEGLLEMIYELVSANNGHHYQPT